MTLDMLFLIVVPVYLVLVAYGQVGSRKRRLGPRARAIAAALRVVLPPLALIAALASTGDPMLLRVWGLVVAAMTVAGAVVALLGDRVAGRIVPDISRQDDSRRTGKSDGRQSGSAL